MKPPRSLVVPLVSAGLAILGASCASSDPLLHPVRGTVLFEGQPAGGATVVFQPAGDATAGTPSGVVADDGTFTLSTHPHGEGAPAGEYIVLVTWLPPNARELEHPKSKLPARYADPTKTPLPKVRIAHGPNALEPFKLTAK